MRVWGTTVHRRVLEMAGPPMVTELGEAYVRQIVDGSPGQRKRYLDQVRILPAPRAKLRLDQAAGASSSRVTAPDEGRGRRGQRWSG